MSRVLLLSHDLSANAVLTTWQFAGALRRLGHRTTIAGPRSGAIWPGLTEELGDARVLDGTASGSPGFAAAVDLARDADVVYAFKAIETSLGLGLALSRATGRPLLLHLDDRDAAFFDDLSPFRRFWLGLRGIGNPIGVRSLAAAERRIPEADGVTVASRALATTFGGTIVRHGFDESRHDPVPPSRTAARQSLGLDPAAPVVLFAGTPTTHKGLPELAQLVERGLPVHIVGGSRAQLQAAGLPDALLDRLRLHPPQPLRQVDRWILASDVFVVPQRDTPFARYQLPAKILHAMSLGRAVVATDVADAGVVLGGDPAAGLLVPPGDADALAEAVGGLIADPARRAELEAEALRRSRVELGWTAMARRLAPILSDVGIDDSHLPENAP